MARRIGWGTQAALLLVGLALLAVGCNSHPVALEESGGSVTVNEDVTPGGGEAVDILWVIDNSGSMCEEQESLRENFRHFITQFSEAGTDFHIGTTTTQMFADHDQDAVARPGHIQAVPQPVPSYLDECHGSEGSGDDQTDGYEPIRSAIETVVDSCAKDPDEWQDLKNLTNGDIDCHLTDGCPTQDDDWEPHELFPVTEDGKQPTWETPADESPYREIPLVMRAEDYENSDGTLDREQLEDDFACMSLVGTRGYAIEEGLGAAARAVSPDITGGPVESPSDESAPNHGLIRQDANFSTIFVTDENDCSGLEDKHLGTKCSSDICSFANHPDTEDSPIDSTSKLAERFRTNLRKSKYPDSSDDVEIAEDELILASIHGSWRRYGEHPDNPE
ncbi:MAG: hypothetical protein ACOCV2_02355, partial [Persicimonas sp.]